VLVDENLNGIRSRPKSMVDSLFALGHRLNDLVRSFGLKVLDHSGVV
jgi:hypothetical protein